MVNFFIFVSCVRPTRRDRDNQPKVYLNFARLASILFLGYGRAHELPSPTLSPLHRVRTLLQSRLCLPLVFTARKAPISRPSAQSFSASSKLIFNFALENIEYCSCAPESRSCEHHVCARSFSSTFAPLREGGAFRASAFVFIGWRRAWPAESAD